MKSFAGYFCHSKLATFLIGISKIMFIIVANNTMHNNVLSVLLSIMNDDIKEMSSEL